MTAAMHPAVAQIRAIRLAREIVDLAEVMRQWREMLPIGDALVSDLHVRGDQRWRELCDHLTRGVIEACRVECRLKTLQAEFIELMEDQDLMTC